MRFLDILKRLFSRIEMYVRIIHARDSYISMEWNRRLEKIGGQDLSKEQVLELSKRYGKKYISSPCFRLYNKVLRPGEHLEDYIPDGFYMRKIEPYFNKPLICQKLEDKNLYDLLFKGFRMPQTILRQIDGVIMNGDYEPVSKEEALHLCRNEKNVIIKVASESGGGHGIQFWNSEESEESLFDKLFCSNNIIVQQVISQHESLSILHPFSINTLRITTILHNGEVFVSSKFVRMGIGGKKIDNVSSGGMLCCINDDGSLSELAYDEFGISYKCHPTTNVKFLDCNVDNLDECINLCKKAALRVSQYAKLISWDIALEKDGKPTLIEANLTVCDIGIYQIACGPILGNKERRDDIISLISKK